MKKKEYKKRLEKEKRQLKEMRESDLNASIKTGIIITISVIGFILLVFVFTKIKTGEWNFFTKENDITYKAEIQTNKVLCGQILNRENSEYYVLGYEIKEDNVVLYESILERYNSSVDKLPLYKLDLSNSRNNICKDDKINISNNIEELKLSVPTLIKIKDGKIVESYITYEKLKEVLLSYIK